MYRIIIADDDTWSEKDDGMGKDGHGGCRGG